MRTRSQRALVGLVATLLGLLLGAIAGFWTGHVITLRQAGARLSQLAHTAMVEGEVSTAESRKVLAQMSSAPLAFCSDEEITYFRELIYESRYLKGAGRIHDNRIACSTTLGRAAKSEARLQPDFTQKDGSRLYRDLPMFRVGDDPVITVQLGDSFIVYSPYHLPTVQGNVHYIVTDHDSETKAMGRLMGEMPNVPVSALASDGHANVNGSLIETRCSPDGTVCMSAYTAVDDALRANSTTQILLAVFGAFAGGLLGFVLSLIYRRKQATEHQLLRAIRRDELRVVYQPIVDIETGQIREAEALVRWTNQDNESVSPDVFIKIAEERGFVGEITRLVVRHVLHDFGPTLRRRPDFRVNVNIAAPDLSDNAFLPMMENALAEAGVAPRSLTVEITESYTARQQVAKQTIMALRERGHEVYIDDFGTGYSSLAYLHDLSVDAIKIDKAFTKAIGTDAVTVSILPQILTMAETLGLRVVVEGIETPQQARYFSGMSQSIFAQGWLYGRPITPEAFHQLLRAETATKEQEELVIDASVVATAVSAA